MNQPENLVECSERLTAIFGEWPSFHDAEVIEFNLWCGEVQPVIQRYVFPTLTVKIHLWELTSKVSETGHYVLRHHTLATLRFHDLHDFKMDDFNHQNVIYGLSITTEESEGKSPAPLQVEFEGCFGVSSTFRCRRIEVIHAEPYPGSIPST